MDATAHPNSSGHAPVEQSAGLHEDGFDTNLTTEDQLAAASERVKAVIRQNPGTCLLGAVAVGFLAGAWASRR